MFGLFRFHSKIKCIWYQWCTEMSRPDMVDRYACGQWIIGSRNPLGQCPATSAADLWI